MRFLRILLFFLVSVSCYSQSQPPEIRWEEYVSLKGENMLFSVAENYEGDLVAVGKTRNVFSNKSDFFFLSMNKNGGIIRRPIALGRKKNEEVYRVIPTYDGGYLVVGFSDSAFPNKGYQGMKDGWVVKLDEKGNPLWDKLFGTVNGDDVFSDAVQLNDGSFVLVGKKRDSYWLKKIDRYGNEEWDEYRQFEGQPAWINKVALTENQQLIVTGGYGSKEEPKLLLMRYTKQGSRKWSTTIDCGNCDWMEGNGVLEDEKGQIWISGVIDMKGTNNQLFLMQTNSFGKQIGSIKNYGGRGDDQSRALVQSLDGDFVMAGFDMSSTRSRARSNYLLYKVGEDKEGVWDKPIIEGSAQNDEFYDVTQLADGSIVGVGFSGKGGLDSKKGLIIKLDSEGIPKHDPPGRLQVSEGRFVYPEEKNHLEPGDRGYYLFKIYNPDTVNAYQIKARLSCDCEQGVDYFNELNFGELKAGKFKWVSVPVFTNNRLRKGDNQFKLSFSEANSASTPDESFEMKSVREVRPNLLFTNHEFFSPSGVQRGDTVTFEVTLENRGDIVAEQTYVRFNYPYKLVGLTKKRVFVGDLPPGESKTVSFRFYIQKVFLEDFAWVQCTAEETTRKYTEIQKYEAAIEQGVPDPELPELDVKEAKLEVFWKVPEPADHKGNIVITKKAVEKITVLAFSSTPLKEKHFTVFLNGDSIVDDPSKFKKQKLRSRGQPNDIDGTNRYVFVNDINLLVGRNEIYVQVTNDDGLTKRTPTITFTYDGIKPNLYLLSIGVPHNDLQFPDNDARDFVEAFKKQAGKSNIFDRVETVLLNKENNTDKLSILKEIENLSTHKIEEIREIDLVVLFISTHGMIRKSDNPDYPEGFFTIAPINYQKMYKSTTSILFNAEIVQKLKKLPGKVFIFIDACFSGAGKDDIDKASKMTEEEYVSNAIQKWVNSEQGIRIFASSSENEKSYEYPPGENGAFTEAILEAFYGEPSKLMESDTNNDGWVSLEELVNYVRFRVPQLVREDKRYKFRKQTPAFKLKKGDDELLLYRINE